MIKPYEVQDKAQKHGFPFTGQPDRLSSMYSIIGHAEVCPVVFEMLERLKVIYRFRNRT